MSPAQAIRVEDVFEVEDVQKRAVIAALTDHIGKDNSISAKDLARQANQRLEDSDRKLGVSSVRDVVQDLRQEGWAIASKSGSGYWLIADRSEFVEFVEAYRQELRNRKQTLQAVVAAWNRGGRHG